MPKQKTSSQLLPVGCNKRSALHRIDRNKVLNLSFLMIVMMVCLAFATSPAPAQAMCAANQGGTPNCSNATAPASLNMTPVNVGVGNPINLITGNKYQQETDLPALPGVLGLEIIRHYNSVYSGVNSQRGVVGRGWRLSYETQLYFTAKSLQIIQADSSRLIFPRDATDPSRCAHPNPAYGQIKIQETAQGKTYQWRWPNGRRLDFNPEGKLVQILAPTGEFVSLQYDPKGWLLRVTDPQGRMLRFNYLDQKAAQKGDRFSGLQSIDSPVGRFSYQYGSPMPKGATIEPIHLLANLVKVSLPTHYDANQPAHPYANRGVSSSSISRTYHYEDANHPTLLTGISITGQGSDNQLINQRISTYNYDINGKAILSMKANGAEKVTLDRSEGGTTILTNSLGQRTTYKHAILAGEYRLLEARGPGCTSCGQTNSRYGYDKLGQLIEETTLNASGQPTQATKTDRDDQGRIVKVSNISYQNGKAQTKNSKWQRRYEYLGTNTEPSLIAQPSVISGKESITKITYNAQGQPTAITQSGWSPAIDSKIPATPITRTTTYRYSTDASATTNTTSKVGELSTYDEHPPNRWMEIDGPLPNGKSNSPIDSDITRIEYDPKTKLVVKTIAPGNVVTDVLERDSALRPSKLRINDGLRVVETQLQYNHTGQPDRVVQQAYFLATPNAVLTRTSSFAYDVAGKLTSSTGPDGITKRAASEKPDNQDKPEHIPEIALLKTTWGEVGTAAQNQLIKLATPHKQAERMFDDFGRVIAIKNPDQGWQTAQYDAADHIIATTDARGARQAIRYTVQGAAEQIERWINNKLESTTQFRYASQQPIEETISDAQGTRRTQTQYDALNREINIRQTTELKGQTPVTFTQTYTYNEQGKRSSIELTDQHGTHSSVRNTYDAEGRITNITTQGWLPTWLGGQKILVRAIQWQQAGAKIAHNIVTSLTHGNGKIDSYTPPKTDTTQAQQVDQTIPPSPRPGSEHDEAGLPHQLTLQGQIWQLNWDAAGRLQTIQQAQSTQASYLYDARGRRVAKIIQDGKTPPQITYFTYDGVQLLGEADAQGNLTHRYAYLGYRPVAQLDYNSNHSWWERAKAWLFGAEIHHLHTDQVGQVISMSDAKQGVLWQMNQTNQPSKTHQPLRYIGQYYDQETGLHYHGARFYEPTSGKFISPDPAGIADALSDVRAELLLDIYAYAGGEPELFFDPDGAAKIRYFAIDDGKKVAQDLQPNQGHWAFAIWDIQGFENNLFAYDKDGKFLGDKTNKLFQGTNIANTTLNDLMTFYNKQSGFYSPTQFETDMKDSDAIALIKAMTGISLGDTINCPDLNKILPPIKLGVQGTLIPTSSNKTDPNRLLQCEAGLSANDVLLRRIQKAIEIHEVKAAATAATDKDCSSETYKGCAANTWNPSVKPGTNLVQPASYGWTQFTPPALSDALRGLSAADLATLGITAAQQADLLKKINGVEAWYIKLVKNGDGVPTAAVVNAGWASNKEDFVKDTGLTKIDYDRMVSFGAIAATLKKINEEYKKPPTSCKKSDAKCFWDNWQRDDPTAKANLLEKARTELGATQVKLNLYIRDPGSVGEGRAGFQWTAIAASPIGQNLLTALADKAKADLLAKSFLNQKMKKARSDLRLTGNNNLSAAQELRLATEILFRQNGSRSYAPKVLPHFKTTFCVAGSAKSTNGYLRMKPLEVKP